MSFDVPLLLGLFSKVASNRDKNFSTSAKRSLLLTLPPSIVLREPSNPLVRLSGNDGKLRKRKPKAALKFQGLRDLGYIKD